MRELGRVDSNCEELERKKLPLYAQIVLGETIPEKPFQAILDGEAPPGTEYYHEFVQERDSKQGTVTIGFFKSKPQPERNIIFVGGYNGTPAATTIVRGGGGELEEEVEDADDDLDEDEEGPPGKKEDDEPVLDDDEDDVTDEDLEGIPDVADEELEEGEKLAKDQMEREKKLLADPAPTPAPLPIATPTKPSPVSYKPKTKPVVKRQAGVRRKSIEDVVKKVRTRRVTEEVVRKRKVSPSKKKSNFIYVDRKIFAGKVQYVGRFSLDSKLSKTNLRGYSLPMMRKVGEVYAGWENELGIYQGRGKVELRYKGRVVASARLKPNRVDVKDIPLNILAQWNKYYNNRPERSFAVRRDPKDRGYVELYVLEKRVNK